MSTTIPTVQKAAAADLPLMTEILGEAFHDDPVPAWMFGKQGMAGPMFTPILKSIYIPQGLCFISQGEEGTAAWLPPGTGSKLGPILTLRMMSLLLFRAKSGGLKRMERLVGKMENAHPKADHYYLFAIGVRPQFQGRGLGKALMKPVLDRADAEGRACYLESSKESNIPVYRAVGFEVTGEIQPAPDSPILYPMWREPQSV